MIGGFFHEGPAYSAWRASGTADFLLIHTTAGAGRLGTAAGELAVGPRDAVLLRPGIRHDYATAAGAPMWEFAFAHFHPRAEWMPLLAWPDAAGGIGVIHSDAEAHRRVTGALRRAAGVRYGSAVRTELFGMNALEEALLWLDAQNPLAGRVDERVARVLEHVGAHLADPLDLATLSRVAHLSPSRLTHLFQDQVGISPRRYVERERMLLAGQLLDLTNRSVTAIAGEVGCDDPLYFSQRFRRFAGLSPSAYRERGRRDASDR
ncbi:AraC family transcriptional regulator, arabinose operon regulatory protein [Microbacterium sp. cf046]|nr:AraC family transcriptional regulator, arabinose operon regulatory protein [Microbacterium sp. cf046]